MGEFNYKAFNQSGKIIVGSIQAENKKEALTVIEEKKLYLFNLEEKKKEISRVPFRTFSFKKREKNLILFTRQLANLLSAGIQLGDALNVLSNIINMGNFKIVVEDIYSSLKEGKGFAESLESHPQYFSKVYLNMIKAGEESGCLDLCCQRLALNLEEKYKLCSFIISSLIYPFILLGVAILAIIIMLVYVLPRFMIVYNSYGQSLPWSTLVLLNISQFLSDYGLLLIVLIGISVLVFLTLSKTPTGKKKLDRFLFRLPFSGSMLTKLVVSRIGRGLGTMLKSGIPLLNSLKITQQIINNTVFREALQKVNLIVKRGGSLSEALNKTGIFPDLVSYMISVGEETGNLSSILLQLGEHFEEEYRQSLERAIKLFEPMLILFMGIIIGFIVIAMLLPVLGLNGIYF